MRAEGYIGSCTTASLGGIFEVHDTMAIFGTCKQQYWHPPLLILGGPLRGWRSDPMRAVAEVQAGPACTRVLQLQKPRPRLAATKSLAISVSPGN